MLIIDTVTSASETSAISIHKVIDDEFTLAPGERIVVKFIVFARRAGTHGLKAFKILDRELLSDVEHTKKGYTFTSQKFTITN